MDWQNIFATGAEPEDDPRKRQQAGGGLEQALYQAPQAAAAPEKDKGIIGSILSDAHEKERVARGAYEAGVAAGHQSAASPLTSSPERQFAQGWSEQPDEDKLASAQAYPEMFAGEGANQIMYVPGDDGAMYAQPISDESLPAVRQSQPDPEPVSLQRSRPSWGSSIPQASTGDPEPVSLQRSRPGALSDAEAKRDIQAGLDPYQAMTGALERGYSFTTNEQQAYGHFQDIARGNLPADAPLDMALPDVTPGESLIPDVTPVQQSPDTAAFLDSIGSYTFDYKNPDQEGAAEGRQLGVMAQDLLKTPEGASMVAQQSDGTLEVDAGRAGLAALGLTADVDKRLRALEGAPAAPPPTAGYAPLPAMAPPPTAGYAPLPAGTSNQLRAFADAGYGQITDQGFAGPDGVELEMQESVRQDLLRAADERARAEGEAKTMGDDHRAAATQVDVEGILAEGGDPLSVWFDQVEAEMLAGLDQEDVSVSQIIGGDPWADRPPVGTSDLPQGVVDPWAGE